MSENQEQQEPQDAEDYECDCGGIISGTTGEHLVRGDE